MTWFEKSKEVTVSLRTVTALYMEGEDVIYGLERVSPTKTRGIYEKLNLKPSQVWDVRAGKNQHLFKMDLHKDVLLNLRKPWRFLKNRDIENQAAANLHEYL